VARRDAAAKRAASGVEEGEPESGLTAWSARWHCGEVLRRRASARRASRRRDAGSDSRRRWSGWRNCAVGSYAEEEEVVVVVVVDMRWWRLTRIRCGVLGCLAAAARRRIWRGGGGSGRRWATETEASGVFFFS
jgi:hypothetical protein